MLRINVGCGQSPIEGWRNFDNSWSVRLAKCPGAAWLLRKMGALDAAQCQFIEFARAHAIEWADAAKRIPVADGSADLLYSSHMLEHLDRSEALAFLREARRVLRPGGLIRLAVPDLRKYVDEYLNTLDADAFVAATNLARPRPRTLRQHVGLALSGTRHQWVFDGASLSRLLESNGFVDVTVLAAEATRIADPRGINLRERAWESVYVEAVSP